MRLAQIAFLDAFDELGATRPWIQKATLAHPGEALADHDGDALRITLLGWDDAPAREVFHQAKNGKLVPRIVVTSEDVRGDVAPALGDELDNFLAMARRTEMHERAKLLPQVPAAAEPAQAAPLLDAASVAPAPREDATAQGAERREEAAGELPGTSAAPVPADQIEALATIERALRNILAIAETAGVTVQAVGLARKLLPDISTLEAAIVALETHGPSTTAEIVAITGHHAKALRNSLTRLKDRGRIVQIKRRWHLLAQAPSE